MSPPIRVASFNVNGIRARLPVLLTWLQKEAPEVVCLQETKVQDSEFPREDLEGLGFMDVFRLHVAEGGLYTFWDYRVPSVLAGEWAGGLITSGLQSLWPGGLNGHGLTWSSEDLRGRQITSHSGGVPTRLNPGNRVADL